MFEFEGVNEGETEARGDPFLASMLLPAMVLGEDIEIEAPVSPMLVASLPRIMDIYAAWAPLIKGRPTVTGALGRSSVRASSHGERGRKKTRDFDASEQGR